MNAEMPAASTARISLPNLQSVLGSNETTQNVGSSESPLNVTMRVKHGAVNFTNLSDAAHAAYRNDVILKDQPTMLLGEFTMAQINDILAGTDPQLNQTKNLDGTDIMTEIEGQATLLGCRARLLAKAADNNKEKMQLKTAKVLGCGDVDYYNQVLMAMKLVWGRSAETQPGFTRASVKPVKIHAEGIRADVGKYQLFQDSSTTQFAENNAFFYLLVEKGVKLFDFSFTMIYKRQLRKNSYQDHA